MAIERPTKNRRMRPSATLFTVDGSSPTCPNWLKVVTELRPQADRLDMVMVQPVSGLMAIASIEGLYLTIVSIPNPDSVALLHRPWWWLADHCYHPVQKRHYQPSSPSQYHQSSPFNLSFFDLISPECTRQA